MIFVRVKVWCDYDAVAEFASRQRLLRLLAIGDAIEFHKYLKFLYYYILLEVQILENNNYVLHVNNNI